MRYASSKSHFKTYVQAKIAIKYNHVEHTWKL